MRDLTLPGIDAYAAAHSWVESDVCRALREETARTMEFPQMVVGPLEGAFLKMMTRISGAIRVLEVGMFTGYSALCFAEALPPEGRIVTCEIDEKPAALARKYFSKSPVGGKIDIKLGSALETLQTVTGPFDLVFIDADKVNYTNYYRRAKQVLSPSGIILIDNVLWSGDVLQQPPPDDSTAAIQELTRIVAADGSMDAVLVTLRDGVLVVTRKA